MQVNYPEVYSKLCYEVATVIFFKKNGDVRVMLATRNIDTVSLIHTHKGAELGGHDSKANINNGNVAVIDIILGEARIFNVKRVIDIKYHGMITTREELEKVIAEFSQFKTAYEERLPTMNPMDFVE